MTHTRAYTTTKYYTLTRESVESVRIGVSAGVVSEVPARVLVSTFAAAAAAVLVLSLVAVDALCARAHTIDN
jgi:hypothetical protein